MKSDNANANAFAASLMIDELVRCGVTQFCLAPGMRCAPLTVAAARNTRARACVHYDERGAGFFALGHARAGLEPAVLICTSGTAAANFLPAVIEASLDMIPMIVLTADRPPELRDTGANQTIDQAKMFQPYVRWQADLPCPDDRLDPAFWLTTIDQAVYRARRSPAGPVHLNCMFREPLIPSPDACRTGNAPAAIARWDKSRRPFSDYSGPTEMPDSGAVTALAETIGRTARGLLLVGSLRNSREQEAVARLSQKLRWPTLPDIRSGLRLTDFGKQALRHYDLLLRSESRARMLGPEVVLQIGGRMVSKRLLRYVEDLSSSEYVLVDNHPFRYDPAHRVSRRIECDIDAFCEALATAASGRTDKDWQGRISRTDLAISTVVENELDENPRLTEPSVARMISRQLGSGSALFLANSMPIRLMDMYAAVGASVPIAANRGASGIDGTVACAAGFAAGTGRPTTLLIGDLALLHDLNSLALLGAAPSPVTVIVLNNNGGGLFDLLPVAEHADVFEEFFVAPHGRTFEKAAAMYDVPYERPDSAQSFTEACRGAQEDGASRLIEVMTDRQESIETHKRIREQIAKALA
ncbi:MAG TPA: 2-succinyl-5-enolpyruvyl-6-hydroxy-3-cyclohexene-1-carboxylic-acid synthase [Acidobacteriota bacterium]|nr:2-succinyl-5-enolpyruvyl-6-hydroxy-3-cyclohexene-1-carboxylic-acid synthase [Acidobacteriota bacterium]